jgi:crotonobetainyl-CoA:carnitine CoA-transferase CaiB-like acyl-CoA transferase
MMAIYRRDHHGGNGQEIDVSLFEPLFRLVESQVIGYDKLGFVKQRLGNRLEEDSPRNAYETADGKFVTISASSPRTWERFAEAIGRRELITDPRFVNNASRCANADALDEIVVAWHRARTLDEVLGVFESYDVVAGPVYDIAAIFADAQYKAREAIISVADPDFGSLRMQNVVPKFSDTPGRVRHGGLAMGSHNDEIYLDVLQLERAEYASLRTAGII